MACATVSRSRYLLLIFALTAGIQSLHGQTEFELIAGMAEMAATAVAPFMQEKYTAAEFRRAEHRLETNKTMLTSLIDRYKQKDHVADAEKSAHLLMIKRIESETDADIDAWRTRRGERFVRKALCLGPLIWSAKTAVGGD